MEFPGRRLRVVRVLTHPAGHFQRQDSFHNVINLLHVGGDFLVIFGECGRGWFIVLLGLDWFLDSVGMRGMQ